MMDNASPGLKDTGWWADFVKERASVVLDIISYGDDAEGKMQALMAGGELPDIVIFKNRAEFEDSIIAGLLINFDDYKEKLPTVYSDHYTEFRQYFRDYRSAETGSLWGLYNGVGTNDPGTETGYGPFLRWDLYNEAGAPRLTSFQDYLPLLKQMQDLEPINENGDKVYGISMFSDPMWVIRYCGVFSSFMAHDSGDNLTVPTGAVPFLDINVETDELGEMLAEGGVYHQALKFYYDANKMGLLDPDSITQTFAGMQEKVAQGRVLFLPYQWMESFFAPPEYTGEGTPVGYRPVFFDGYARQAPLFSLGNGRAAAIGKNTKKIDACLRYIDFLASFDASQTWCCGPEGVTWHVAANGEPEMTEFGLQCIDNPDTELPGGMSLLEGTKSINWGGPSNGSVNPANGAKIHYNTWESWKNRNPSPLLADWQQKTGFKYTVDMIIKGYRWTGNTNGATCMPPVPDDLKLISASCQDIVETYSWQMIYAKNEAEFDKLWNDMIAAVKGLGIDELIEWGKVNWAASVIEGIPYKRS